MALLKDTLVVKLDVKSVSDELHRFNFPRGSTLCFADLDKKIRTRFDLPVASKLRMTYKDNEGEVVVMADDDDLRDAVSLQALNPLRLNVVIKSGDAPPRAEPVTGLGDSPTASVPDKGMGTKSSEVVAAMEQLVNVVKRTDTRAGECIQRVMQQLDERLGMTLEKSLEDTLSFRHIPGTTAARSILEILKGKVPTSQAPSSGTAQNMKSDAVPAGEVGMAPEPTIGVEKAAEPTVAVKSTPSEKGESSQQGEIGNSSGGDKPVRSVQGCSAADEDGGVAKVFHTRIQCDGCAMLPIVGPRFKSTVKHDYDLCETCYNLVEDKDKENYGRIDRPLYKPRHHPFWGPHRSRGKHLPYNPPVFFGGRPFHPAHGHRGPFGPPPPPFFPCNQQQGFAGDRAQDGVGSGKLDSRFVRDVSIFDGTELNPGTNFTKIWCLRNSGTIPWPQGTALLHIGGDKLGEVESVPLPLPPSGLAVGEESEVAVDSVAPQWPGRYVSHWRLVAPSGQRFGHRVWVLIQVVPKGELSPEETALLANTAVKVEEVPISETGEVAEKELSAGSVVEEVEVSSPQPVSEELLITTTNDAALESSEPVQTVDSGDDVNKKVPDIASITSEVVDGTIQLAPEADQEVNIAHDVIHEACTEDVPPKEQPMFMEDVTPKEQPKLIEVSKAEMTLEKPEVDIAANIEEPIVIPAVPDSPTKTEDTSVGGFALLPYPAIVTTPIVVDDLMTTTPAIAKDAETPVTNGHTDMVEVEMPKTSEDEFESDEMDISEDPALAQLKAMGFSDMELNAELLVKNNFDIMRTVDDLVAAAEWDPMLVELEEMGFMDVQMNRRLMFKNKGSVKRTVKELVETYKAEAQQRN